MKNINYITLNCFQPDCIFVYIIYSYSASQHTVTYLFSGAHTKNALY